MVQQFIFSITEAITDMLFIKTDAFKNGVDNRVLCRKLSTCSLTPNMVSLHIETAFYLSLCLFYFYYSDDEEELLRFEYDFDMADYLNKVN